MRITTSTILIIYHVRRILLRSQISDGEIGTERCNENVYQMISVDETEWNTNRSCKLISHKTVN